MASERRTVYVEMLKKKDRTVVRKMSRNTGEKRKGEKRRRKKGERERIERCVCSDRAR